MRDAVDGLSVVMIEAVRRQNGLHVAGKFRARRFPICRTGAVLLRHCFGIMPTVSESTKPTEGP